MPYSSDGYTIQLTNGTTLGASDPDGGLILDVSQVANSVADTGKVSIGLIRRGARQYSDVQGADLVHMLENFANATPPFAPLIGQLWFNSSTNMLEVYNNSQTWGPVVPSTVSSLTTPRNIGLKNDATGSVPFDGSADVQIPVSLAASGVVPGTYTAPTIVVDAKGRITSASSSGAIGAGAIIAALGYTPANDANVVHKSGDTMTGALTTTDLNVTSGKVREGGNPLVPRGAIMIWFSSTAPAGWANCDGLNGTPNLNGCFLVGLGGNQGYGLGARGGVDQVTVTTDTQGNHNHNPTMDQQGSHAHGGSTGGTGLTVDQLAEHVHGLINNDVVVWGQSSGKALGGNLSGGGLPALQTPNPSQYGLTDPTGSGNPHYHSIGADGLHAHNISETTTGNHAHNVSFDNRPSYCAVNFIMKL